jgi:uncharacterized membrane protein YdjX (TVP38/TMEM64 family)
LQAGVEPPSSGQGGKPWRGIILFCLTGGAMLSVAYFSPLRQYLSRYSEISGQLRSLGLLAPLSLTLLIALLVAVGFPRLPLCVLAGMSLGFWLGLLCGQTGALLGSYLVFGLARWSGRSWTDGYLAERKKIQSLIQRGGAWGVVLARQLPVPNMLVNVTCGLLPVSARDFAIGTVIGQIPQAIPCTLIGAGLLEESILKSMGLISLAIIAALFLWAALRPGAMRGCADSDRDKKTPNPI